MYKTRRKARPYLKNFWKGSIGVELGSDLWGNSKNTLTEGMSGFRQNTATSGEVFEPIRLYRGAELQPNGYRITLDGAVIAAGSLEGEYLFIGRDHLPRPKGQEGNDPVFGFPCFWGDSTEEATEIGFTVVDRPTVLATHIFEIIKNLNYSRVWQENSWHYC